MNRKLKGTKALQSSVRKFCILFSVLTGLVLVSAGLSFVRLGGFEVLGIMLVAFVSVGIIVFYFMELGSLTQVSWLWAGAGLLWFGILFVLAMTDYLTRSWVW
ncbi:MAG: hypothetical protein JOY96_10710 [Verrucomicrobia bacterium]|nr:hypothetical protein [Verrucomicrobiota bacterium]MBV9673619.1 hypothetical protein [Verrucomicrobiota bacterium]